MIKGKTYDSFFRNWMKRPWIAGRALQFFTGYQKTEGMPIAYTLSDFYESLPGDIRQEWNMLEVKIVLSKLEELGFLFRVADNPQLPVLGTSYGSSSSSSPPPEGLLQYGSFEFCVFGHPLIYNRFKESVLLVEVEKENGTLDVGTAFLVTAADGTLLVTTARHCIEGRQYVRIYGWDHEQFPCEAVFLPKEEYIDVAMIMPRGNPFGGIPTFRFDHGNILDHVITMGYPPIPGFESPLIAESSTVAGYLKSTEGEVTGIGQSPIGKQDYLLISARVKGGNSGGPVINSRGDVIGVITDAPQNADELDHMGYGVATPYKSFEKSISPERSVNVKTDSNGFQIDMV